ncbi:ABC transporter ATP-binding protein/permease [Candidatus Pelagibacter sp.]|nr:ABC transporter ATP-binding protein/permease [Candidatus Pelagibacter sp.]
MHLLFKLFNFASLEKKKKFYIIQTIWLINSIIQSINIYVYGYFLIILGKEFGELDENFSILNTNFELINYLNLLSFSNLVFLIILFAIFSNLFNFYLIKYSNNHFCQIAENIQYRLLKKYVFMEYQEFLNLRLDKKSSSILMDSQKLYSLLMSFGVLFFNISNLIIIFSILLIINFKITLIAFFALGLMYFIFAKKTKSKLNYNSKVFSELGTDKLNLINTCLNGLKELKIYNLEVFNLNKFKNLTAKVASSKSSTVTLSVAPRYFVESFFFLSLGIIIFLISNVENIEKGLFSYLLILIISFSRLIPSFQYLYGFFSVLQDGSVSLNRIYDELIKDKEIKENQNSYNDKQINTIKPKNIKFKDVEFKFQSNNKNIIQNLNCDINLGDKVFIEGETGVGKSTFLDIFSGLLKITQGKIIINKEKEVQSLNKIFKQAYVSQFPFLYNSTIIQNIALKDVINDEEFQSIKNIIKILSLDDIIKDDEDYHRLVGDFGNKISGGQKQRICIARGIFLKPDILILDESLNAVDQVKRKNVIKNIININKNQIILYVSHDKKDLVNFNKHFLFKKNEITQVIV